MLRKILSLCLVAVMLSTVAFATEFVDLTPVYAAEEAAETFEDVAITQSGTEDNPFEFLWVTQSETDGVVSQKITTVDQTDSAKTMAVNNWALAKINVGENREFSYIKFQTRWQMWKTPDNQDDSSIADTSYVYCAPLSYTDYAAAAAIAGTSDTLSTLVKPSPSDTNVKVGTLSKKTHKTTQNIPVTLDAETFNDSNYYHDGYIYLAFYEGDETNKVYNDKMAVKPSDSGTYYWKLTISGTIVEPAVTDFSDSVITWNDGAYTVKTATASGTAMLIAASFNGTTMVDAKVATIDAADAVDGVISGTISDLAAGDSVKIFLWAENTLVPAIGVSDF